MNSPESAPPNLPRETWFLTTHWSVVLAAGDSDSPQNVEALEMLCRTYWYPIYAYVRRQGYQPSDAEDLTQGFFARLLAKRHLRSVGPEKGRFRTFLLVALKRFLINERDKAHALKRGGGQAPLPLDTTAAEGRYQNEPRHALSPEQLFDRRWALALLDQAMKRLRAEYERSAKRRDFDHLKEWLTAERGAIPYAALAAALHTSEEAARVAVHRLRRRFREVFREEIAHTVSAQEVEEEILHLLSVLSLPQGGC